MAAVADATSRTECESAGFFDRFSRFLETSSTAVWPNRLNRRYRAIIEANRDLLRGRRVLDIASHDGRWSFAALQAGSVHVTGIEARAHLVANANATLRHYGIGDHRFKFIAGDAFEVLSRQDIKAETVLLLGFFYHIHRHVEMASLVARTGASHVILDTMVIPEQRLGDDKSMIQLVEEPTDFDGNAVGPGETALVGRPSREAIRLIFGHFGFTMREIDWSVYLGNSYALDDYVNDMRATFVLTRA